MNPFCAEHPMASQPSMLDAKAYPVLSCFCRSFILALVLTPVLFGLMLFSDLRNAYEIGAEINPIPGTLLELALAMGEIFSFCLLFALGLFLLYRLTRGAARWRRSDSPPPSRGRGLGGGVRRSRDSRASRKRW